jgi:DNA repair protein RadA/Sms
VKKEKTVFVCQECGYSSPKWLGKCPSCGSWNSLVEEREIQERVRVSRKIVPKPIGDYIGESYERLKTGFLNLDQSLDGGLVPGQVLLLAGEPGIGKSTLLLQVCNFFSKLYGKTFYISGEESPTQISMRAKRLGVDSENLFVYPETNLEEIVYLLEEERPSLLVVDSIQTLFSSALQSSPGSVAQVRECAFRLSEICKEGDIPLLLVGQVNKEGVVAGPKVLEHIVDTVLYFEGERFSFYRLVKVVKNRFGAGGNVAVFKMSSSGLEEVPEPSAFFLQERVHSPGSVLFSHTEGSKPVILEVQALTIQALYTTPQRRTQGFDVNRLALILAVLEKEGKIFTRDKDVFVNIVGGIRVEEPAVDLAVAMAVASSVKDKKIEDVLVLGEVGLSGEVRSVHSVEERLKEGLRFGFRRAIVPKGCHVELQGMDVLPVKHIREAIDILL